MSLTVDGLDRVFSGRDILNRERAILARHRIEWMVQDSHVGEHPGMNFTLEFQKDFRVIEGIQKWFGALHLRLVRFLVPGHRWQNMHIMKQWVGILYFQFLLCL